jgi:hypothetical protein
LTTFDTVRAETPARAATSFRLLLTRTS